MAMLAMIVNLRRGQNRRFHVAIVDLSLACDPPSASQAQTPRMIGAKQAPPSE